MDEEDVPPCPIANWIIEDILRTINTLPISAEEFLGEELYEEIGDYLGWEREEEDEDGE